MIKDILEKSYIYENISDNLKEGFNWLKTNNLKEMPDGKYSIKNTEIYANIQTYETKDDALFEAHKDYIDIQYMINGEEVCGVDNYDHCTMATDYDKAKDIEFLNGSENADNYILRTGEFLVFFPQDAHKPAIKNKKNALVKKVVVKVHI